MVDKIISFRSLSFPVSCYDDDLACQMVINLSKGICIYRKDYSFKLTVLKEDWQGHRIRMLSPLVARRTSVEDGKMSQLVPNQLDFAQAIYKNLCRKYHYFYGEDYRGTFALLALSETLKATNAKFENLYIKGYMGTFYLVVEPRALGLLYNLGLGEKNAQGFGMFEMEEQDISDIIQLDPVTYMVHFQVDEVG